MIEEGKKIHAKEKSNILLSDCYDHKAAKVFEEDDFLSNTKDSKKLPKALKFTAKAIEKEKRGKYGVQGYSN